MNKITWISALILFCGFLISNPATAKGPLDPVRLNSMTITAGVGPGAHYFGNGIGFGPAFKATFEKGMWDLGPGVITMGGEFTGSLFSNRYGDDWRESWANFIFGARAAWHYGWDVEGLDTYAGLPAGIGFCAHSYDDYPGAHGSQPVYPYFGFFFGASWFFNKSLGINGEVGYNATHANIGVVYKL